MNLQSLISKDKESKLLSLNEKMNNILDLHPTDYLFVEGLKAVDFNSLSEFSKESFKIKYPNDIFNYKYVWFDVNFNDKDLCFDIKFYNTSFKNFKAKITLEDLEDMFWS